MHSIDENTCTVIAGSQKEHHLRNGGIVVR
jgi:hypothetical protein